MARGWQYTKPLFVYAICFHHANIAMLLSISSCTRFMYFYILWNQFIVYTVDIAMHSFYFILFYGTSSVRVSASYLLVYSINNESFLSFAIFCFALFLYFSPFLHCFVFMLSLELVEYIYILTRG